MTQPQAVKVNIVRRPEALEIARRFSTDESVQFINGVLDAVRKALEAGQDTPDAGRSADV